MRRKPVFFFILPVIFGSFGVFCFENEDNCRGNCVSGTSRHCLYNFYVTDNANNKIVCNGQDDHCDYKLNPSLLINGKSPGPAIEVCLGDTIDVIVHNRMKSDELSFHWNGIHQKSSVHMDGVPMITQCPISPYMSFRYHLKPSKAGTFFYHAHSVVQQGDGLFGSLIVRGPKEDADLDKILVISARTSRPLSAIEVEAPKALELLVNGKRTEDHTVAENLKYKLRVINANALNCPIALSVSHHNLKVVSVDSHRVRGTIGKRAILFPGERFDIELETSRTPGTYAIVLEGGGDCRNLLMESNLVYRNAEVGGKVVRDSTDNLGLPENVPSSSCDSLEEGTICSMDLRGVEGSEWEALGDPVGRTFFVNFDDVFYDIEDTSSDYKFKIYGFTYYPAYLSVSPGGVTLPQINGMSFKYPSSPILSQPEAVAEEIFCDLEGKSRECLDRPLFCECLQIMEVPAMENIDVVLINEGKVSNTSYIFHLHGYSAAILGFDRFDRSISRAEMMSLNSSGKLHRNFARPLRKDTFVVPPRGYLILRIFTDNLGYWLWESRPTGASPNTRGPALQFLMRVGPRESVPTVPLDFPTCGNHKGPDLIFHDE